ncbi:hypothetical protein REPUB_Repub13aG0029600 [Reevesia pubescens]
MGHQKSNNVDKIHPFYPQLQNSEHIGFQSLSNEAVFCTGINGVGTLDMPLNVLSSSPFHLGDMSLADIDWMTDAYQLHTYKNSMVDPYLIYRIDCMPSQYSTFENIAANRRGLRMGMQGPEMDGSKPQSIGNSMSSGSRSPFFWGAQDGKEMGSNNNLVDCVVQSDYPETLDGSFLTLGVGVNTEATPKSNDSSREFIGKIDGAMHTQLIPSLGQSGYGSPLSPDFKMTAGLPIIQTYAGRFSSIEENTVGLSSLKHNFGGLPSIVQYAGESFNVSAFAGSMQNVDGCALSEYDLGVAASTSSNFSLSPLQMLPIPQSHLAHSFLTPGDEKFGAGFADIDLNQGFHDLSGVSSNPEHIIHQLGLPPSRSFRSLSGTSGIVHSNRQSGLPIQEQQRTAPRPSLSSFTRKYDMLASHQLQKYNMGSIPSLQWGTSAASPVLGNIDFTSSQYQSDVWQHYHAGQDSAIQTVENAPFSKRMELHLADQLFACDGSVSQVASSFPFSKNFAVQTANKLSASDGNAAEVVSIVSSSNNIGAQAATYLGQSQNNTPIQASKNLLDPAYTPGQVIPFAGGNGTAMTSNLLAPQSLKRKAAQPPSATQVIKKTTSGKPPIRSSTLYKAHNAPSVAPLPPVVSQVAHVPSLVQSISSVPPVTVTARPLPPLARKGPPIPSLSPATPTYRPLARTTPVHSSARMSTPPHIKWQDTERLELSGHNCLLCKRDLSYTPEGPVFQPAAPPHVAVLPCGHCFHDLCLQRITPKDQANNPPCIPCVVGES